MKTVEEQATIIVNRVVDGKYDIEIFNELWEANDIVGKNGYSSLTFEEQKTLIPHFYGYRLANQRKILKRVNKILLEEIKKPDNSFLSIVRILEALECTGDLKKVKKVNNKIKFCIEFYNKTFMVYQSAGERFKAIALLDRV